MSIPTLKPFKPAPASGIPKPLSNLEIKHHKNKGYITLISLIVVSAVATAITLSLILLGLSSSRSSFSKQQGSHAGFLAHACIESALRSIRDDTGYTGSNSLSFNEGNCDYTVTSQGGEQRTIQATGQVGATTKRVEAQTSSINPSITLNYWREVTEF